MNIFELHPSPIINARVISTGAPPILVIDRFYAYPEKVRDYALSLNFNPSTSDHPGRYAAGEKTPGNIIDFLFQHYGRHFPGVKKFWHQQFDKHINFRLLHAKKTNLTFKQSIPHADPQAFVGIVYLNKPEQCIGGTGFYHHAKTGVRYCVTKNVFSKKICPGELLHFMSEKGIFLDYLKNRQQYQWHRYTDMLDDILLRGAVRQNYITHSNQQWKLIKKIAMRFNRLVLYPGFFLHSLYHQDNWFGDDPNYARLTQNFKIDWPS